MGNFWKYNDRVSTGAGVTGLDTADGGDAIADNEIIRGDGTTGIQGSAVTIADTTGTITFPQAANILSAGGATIELDFGGAGRISLGGTDRELYLDGTNNYIAIRSDTQFGWSTSIGNLSNQVGLDGSTSGVLKVTDGGTGLGSLYGSVVGSITANGASTNIKTSATTVNLSGATSTATGLFPAKCIQLGVTVRVTTLAASGDGGTSMNIGDGTDPDRYGATIAFAAGTTVNLSDATADPRGWAAAAGDVVFTCVGGTFNAGVVRVVAHYIDLTAPAS